MSFGGLYITDQGKSLQTKAQTGIQLNFTRIAVGDGELSGQAISDLTALINEVKSISITRLKTMPEGKALVGGILSNQDLQTGFYWRELGVFAQDPDIGEILYCYGNAGDLAEYIPSPGGAEIIEKRVDVITIVDNASDITATIEQSLVFVTQQDFEAHTGDNVIHITEAERTTWDSAETNANSYTDIKAAEAEANANDYTDSKVDNLAGTGRTTETVKGNADSIALLQEKVDTPIYVSDEVTADIFSPVAEGQFSEFTLRGNTAFGIIRNGNFSDGSDWTPINGVESVANNTYTLTGNGSSASIYAAQDTGVAINVSNSYFVNAFVRVTNADCNSIVLVYDGTTAGTNKTVYIINNPIQNQWYPMPTLDTPPADATGNFRILIGHIYADAATANGKALEIRNVVGVDATAEGLDSESAADLAKRFPHWFNGTKSTLSLLIQSVNENIFDGEMERGSIQTSNGINDDTTVDIAVRSKNYIKIDPTRPIYMKNSLGISQRQYYYDEYKNFITYGDKGINEDLTPPSNARYIRFRYLTTDLDIKTQIKYDTAVSEIVEHDNSKAYINWTGRSVGTANDELSVLDGKATQNTKEYILQASDITSFTVGTINDFVRIAKPVDYIGYNSILSADNYKRFSLNSYGHADFTSSTFDDAEYTNKISGTGGSTTFMLAVPHGTYADLAAAQADLAGASLIYQLTSPVISYLPPKVIKVSEKGTIIVEKVIGEVGFYDAVTGLSVSDTTIPIDSLKYVHIVDPETGAETPVDLSTCTIAGDGLSFTSTALSDGELVSWDYWYPPELGTIPTIFYTIASNMAARVTEISNATVRLQKQVDTSNKLISANTEKIAATESALDTHKTSGDHDDRYILASNPNVASFKKDSATFTDNDTSQSFSDSFCTADSLVTIVIKDTTPAGVWTVESYNGYFVITSDTAESTDIPFDYYIQKAGV